MPNIVTNNLKLNNSKNFVDNFSATSTNSLYMFLGKPSKWEDDTVVPNPVDSQQTIANTWDEMISLKKILPENIINVVKRINWSMDEVYDPYDNQDENLLDKSFYVLNKEFNVYKCIDNNNGAISKVEPTGKSLDIITLSDRYRWKYLYSISTGNQLKFLTNNWMPVLLDSAVVETAKPGAIENIQIINSGIDYSVLSTITITGDGQDAYIIPRSSLGVLYDFTYSNNGNGYRYATAKITDPTGVGRYANIKAIVSPIDGHGYDPISELGSHYVMINVKTEYNEGFGDFPSKFTFRKLGIIKNPIDRYNNIANSSTLNALSGIYLNSSSGDFSQYEYIEGLTSMANAYVVASNITAGNGYIKYIQTFGLTNNYDMFIPGETVIGKTSGTTAKISNLLYPEVMHDKGEILYIENRSPITRSIDQTDNLHLVIEF